MKTFSYTYRAGLMAGTVFTLAIGGHLHAQAPANLEPVLRELGIMRNIFAGAMEQDRGNKFFGGGPAPDALYLAGQGMVFSFNLPGNGGFNYDFDGDVEVYIDAFGGLPAVPAAPIAPAAAFDSGMSGFRAALEQLRATTDQLNARNDELRELNEVLRDQSEELREVQREMRNLAREQRSNPDDDSLESQMETLREQSEELQNKLQQQSETYRQASEDIQQERIAAANTLREAQIDQVLGILCDYGSTLKALPADENVSLVFPNVAGNTDQVFVFSHAEVANCTSADSLQQSAISYQASAAGITGF